MEEGFGEAEIMKFGGDQGSCGRDTQRFHQEADDLLGIGKTADREEKDRKGADQEPIAKFAKMIQKGHLKFIGMKREFLAEHQARSLASVEEEASEDRSKEAGETGAEEAEEVEGSGEAEETGEAEGSEDPDEAGESTEGGGGEACQGESRGWIVCCIS